MTNKTLSDLEERAKDTLTLQDDPTADTVSFWRARACYFAEEILRRSPTADLEALDGEIQDAAIRIICVGLPVGESVCVAPNCECYEKHGKQIIAALWKLLAEAIAKARK